MAAASHAESGKYTLERDRSYLNWDSDRAFYLTLEEPTAGAERERFIRLTRGGFQEEDEDDDHRAFMNSTQNRMNRTLQMNKAVAAAGGSYKGPVIYTHKTEKNMNNCQIGNDAHAKATNNGFSRGYGCRFYAHWELRDSEKEGG